VTRRERVRARYGGLCAYSGAPLGDVWQVDHVMPVRRGRKGKPKLKARDGEDNMVPCLAEVNHYKSSLSVERFRARLLTLHRRLARLPANPRTDKGRRRKAYLLKVAGAFGITTDAPFDGVFHFEKEVHATQHGWR